MAILMLLAPKAGDINMIVIKNTTQIFFIVFLPLQQMMVIVNGT